MLRRELPQSLLVALASQHSRAPQSKPPARGRGHAQFPVAGAACTCESEWAQFPAAGFSKPACGAVYNRRFRPENGLPLGAIDAGRLDLQADGTLGYCTMFNSICPQRGPLNLPFLGFTPGEQLWVLVPDRRGLELAEHRPRRYGRPAVLQRLRPEHDALGRPGGARRQGHLGVLRARRPGRSHLKSRCASVGKTDRVRGQ